MGSVGARALFATVVSCGGGAQRWIVCVIPLGPSVNEAATAAVAEAH